MLGAPVQAVVPVVSLCPPRQFAEVAAVEVSEHVEAAEAWTAGMDAPLKKVVVLGEEEV